MTHDVHVNSLKKGCICTLETNTGKKQSLSGGELGDNPLLLQCLRVRCLRLSLPLNSCDLDAIFL